MAVNFLTPIKLWGNYLSSVETTDLGGLPQGSAPAFTLDKEKGAKRSEFRGPEEPQGEVYLTCFERWHKQKWRRLLLPADVCAPWAESSPLAPAHSPTAARQTWKATVWLLIYIISNFPKVSSSWLQSWAISFAASFLHGCLDTRSPWGSRWLKCGCNLVIWRPWSVI